MKPRVLVIAGPTASGKSALALDLAAALDGEIICADSLTVYRGLDIGSAKPTAEQQRQIPHHLLDIREPTEPFTAADFKAAAQQPATQGFEMNSFSWDDTPTPGQPGEATPASAKKTDDDDFNSLFGDLDGSEKK